MQSGSWWLDAKLGVRMLIKYPGLALSGGAGIAVAVAIAAGGFSVIYGNFLASSLPLDEGDRVVSIHLWNPAANEAELPGLYDFHVWSEQLTSIREISAFRNHTPNLIAPGAPPEPVRAAAMTASGFSVARVKPLLGRYLTRNDEQRGAPPVVVIGESVWRSRFAGDPAIAGRAIQLGATSYTIAGVMPKGFAFPVNHQFWIPLQTGLAPPEPLSAGPRLRVFGRLAPGITIESAQAELTAIGRRTAVAFPKGYATLRPQVAPYSRSIFGKNGSDDWADIVLMQGLVVSLLVLVCLNVAILVYTRTAMRQSEIGLRTALGAGRGRIVAQLFMEALVLSAAATVVGVAMAAFALRQVAAATQPIASELPFWVSFRLSPRAILSTGALSVLAAMIVGIVPALQATGRRLQTGLRVVGAGDSGMRLGKIWTILIVGQVGFALALLPPAVFNAWQSARNGLAGLGFAAEEFLSAQLAVDPATGAGTAFDRFPALQTELLRRLQADPRVSGVTFALALPGDEPSARIEVEGAAVGEIHEARFNHVSLNFFPTFEVPVQAGRGFEAADLATPMSPGRQPQGGTVVVNQSLAVRLFGDGGNALGRRIRYATAATAEHGEGPSRWYEIGGIVSDFPTGVSAGMRDSVLTVYHAVGAGQALPASIALRIRPSSRGDGASAFSQRLREVAAEVDPELLLREVRGLDEALQREQWIVRLEAAVLVAVTLSVLVLSSAGVYALMAFTVSQRRREIGIRMALGASPKRILASVFRRALLQLAGGAAIGAATSLLFEKASGGNLMQGKAPAVLLAVALVLMTVGMLAALGPVLQSLRIEPTEALREQ